MTIEEINSKDLSFRYQMLGRLNQDCKYFLGNGQGNSKNLWANTPEEHIEYMLALFNAFSEEEKPEWLSMSMILSYRDEMLKDCP
jgi:hypothetical protein